MNEQLRDALIKASLKIGHQIADHKITLFSDVSKEGNALSQLADRLVQAVIASQAQQDSECKPYGFVVKLTNGTKHFYEASPYLDNAISCDPVYLMAQNATALGVVHHYAAPAGLPTYVNVQWYGKPPKNGSVVYTTPAPEGE